MKPFIDVSQPISLHPVVRNPNLTYYGGFYIHNSSITLDGTPSPDTVIYLLEGEDQVCVNNGDLAVAGGWPNWVTGSAKNSGNSAGNTVCNVVLPTLTNN